MIIYNVTIKVEHTIAAPFIQWMREEHIPDVVNTGCFTQGLIFHLLEADDDEGITYAIQYHAKDYAHYKKYLDQFAESRRKDVIDKWGNKFIAFRTVMQAVN
jgi:hypothetical protein